MKHMKLPGQLPSLSELQQYLKLTPDFRFMWVANTTVRDLVGKLAGSVVTKGYRRLRFKGITIAEHRLVWLYTHGYWPADQLDHDDGDKLNNDPNNLREADNRQNGHNRPSYGTNKSSSYRGVGWYKKYGKWVCRITSPVTGKRELLGYFSLEEQAHEVFEAKAKEYHGEFYCVRK
jgi:hypothetical protein